MCKYLFKVKFTLIGNEIKGYLIEFPEIQELEPTTALLGRELYDAKGHLCSFINKLFKEDRHIFEVTRQI